MYGLPAATEVRKALPKAAIYRRFQLTAAAKNAFDADVSSIEISHELSPQTLSVAADGTIRAIYVLTLQAKRRNFAPKSLQLLSKLIDQTLLFAVQFEGKTCFGLFQDKLYLSPWQPETEAVLRLDGLTLDAIWTSFVKGIVGGEWNVELSLTENLTQIEERQRIEQEIARLEKLARKEKQPRKKFELVERINLLKGEIQA